MKNRNDVYSHFAKVEVAGDNAEAGNGLQLNPGASSAASELAAVGDDTNVGLTLTPKGTGLVTLGGTAMTAGAGISAAETYKSGAFKTGSLITSSIMIDLTGLVGAATDLDIIGNTGGTASANFGQVTAARNGALVGGRVTCLEVPAGGTADIDFYSATESTGAQDAGVATLTETALITAGGAWTSGAVKGMTALPAANEYLYVVCGTAAGGTYSAGKFLIELFGS